MSELDDSKDPFTPQNAPAWALIVEMRNYDVLMGILTVLEEIHNSDKPKHKHLNLSDTIYEAHIAGKLVSEPPTFVVPSQEEDEQS